MATIPLRGNLDLASVDGLRAVMLDQVARMPEGTPIALQMTPATTVDAAGLQLLLCLWHAAAERGSGITLLETPPALRRWLDTLNLADRFSFA